MSNNSNRQIWFIALVILFGCLIGTCISMFIGFFFPDGVVKDFFLTSTTIGDFITKPFNFDTLVARMQRVKTNNLFFNLI